MPLDYLHALPFAQVLDDFPYICPYLFIDYLSAIFGCKYDMILAWPFIRL